MENKARGISMNKIIVVLPLGIVIVIIATAIASTTNIATNAIIAGLTAALVYVTAAYAYFTYELASISKRTAEIALNAEYNSAAPVISINLSKTSATTTVLAAGKSFSGTEYWIEFTNIGKGPSLNLRCWIEEPNQPQFRNTAYYTTAVAVGSGAAGGVSVPVPNHKLGFGYIRVQYESIFGVTYESCMMYPTNSAPELKYGKATEKIVI